MANGLTSSEVSQVWEEERRKTGSALSAERAVQRAEQHARASAPGGDAGLAVRARARISEAHRGIAALGLDHMRNRAEIEKRPITYYNPDGHLSGKGVGEARKAEFAHLRDADLTRLDHLREQLEQATKHLLDVISREPEPTADELARRAAYWRRTEPLLDAGRLPSMLVREAAKVDELLALREELPARLRLLNTQPGVLDSGSNHETNEILEQIDSRLAEMGNAQGVARVGLAELIGTERTIQTAKDMIHHGRVGFTGIPELSRVAASAPTPS